MTSDSKHQEDELRDEPGPIAGAEAAPWEKRYEKLWVEVEKQHVKSNYKNVACELKQKFGELLRSAPPAEEEEQEQDEPGEDSSDEEEGEAVRPTARARSSILLTIPEQTESGVEDSDRSTGEDRRQVQEQQTSSCPGPDSSTHQERTQTARASTNHQPKSHNEFLSHEATVSQQGVLWKQNTASCAAPAQEASLEGLEEKEEERFKVGAATPKVALQDLEKDNCGHQREVEEAVALIVA